MKLYLLNCLLFINLLSCKKITSLVSTLSNKKDYYILKNQGTNLDIKFLTFNILASIDTKALSEGYASWSKRETKVLEYIESQDADFVALQECTAGQLDYFIKNLSARYHIIENKSYTPDSILLVKRDGFEIIEKGHWILLENALEFGIRRIAVWAKVRHRNSQREIMAVGTHVDAKAIKKEQIQRLFTYLEKHQSSKAPLFVAGDFNTTPDDEDYEIIIDKGWKDSFLDTKDKIGATYPAKKPTRRIDHIFYYPKESLEVKSWTVDSSEMSDHLPVITHLHIPQE